jgi:hypothetical protein
LVVTVGISFIPPADWKLSVSDVVATGGDISNRAPRRVK